MKLVDGLSLAQVRAFGARALVVLMAAGVLATLAAGLATGSAYLGSALLVSLAALAVPAWHRARGRMDATTRLSLGLAAPLVPAALLLVMTGHPWQADMHMTFFVVIAAMVALCDWRAIVAATGVTAAHHLALNFLAPAFVFGGQGALGRVLLHAVIVLIETGFVSWAALVFVALLERAARAAADAEAAAATVSRDEAVRAEVMGALRDGLGGLAAGDLTARLDQAFPPAYEPLRLDFNQAAAQLEDTMRAVVEAVANIEASTREIASAADDLSRRTERQAATLEETNAAQATTSGAVKQVAQRAGESEKLFDIAFTEAEQGDIAVGNAKRAMEEIARSAQAISSIVALIDGIAFQTTLLALNAGVEAARSGEAGRGFAVVATEVRSLAEKAAGAASEIRGLIQTSTGQIDRGVVLVEQAGSTVRAVVERFGGVRALIGEIAASTADQARAIGTVDQAIRDIDKVTQSNAAMVEQSSAATRSLAADVARLAAMARQFRFGAVADAAGWRAAA